MPGETSGPGPAGYLVVGLGNPGAEYEFSPHNAGFLVIDRLADRSGIRVSRKDSRALVGPGQIEGAAVLLAKPQTYMNLSGTAVRPLMEKHGFTAGDLIVVYDDHDLPFASLRIRQNGSAGGHHGMESVIRSIGTQDFVRLRIGINPGREKADPDFLLKPFRREQWKQWSELLDDAAQAVALIISEGVSMAMTRFNRRAQGKEEE